MALSVSITYTLNQVIQVDPIHTQLAFTLFNSITGLTENDTVNIPSVALDSGVTDGMNQGQRTTQVNANFLTLINGNIQLFANKCRIAIANQDASMDILGASETIVADSINTNIDIVKQLVNLPNSVIIFE